MTDEDVVARVATLLESSFFSLGRRESHHKPVFFLNVRGERAVDLMRSLYPHMGYRRREQMSKAMSGRPITANRRPYVTEISAMSVERQQGDFYEDIALRYGIRPKSVSYLIRGERKPIAQVLAEALVVTAAEQELEDAVGGDRDLAWLAGLYEGEGCFAHRRIQLSMKDRDVVERAAKMIGSKVSGEPERRRSDWSPMWRTYIYGQNAIDLAMKIRPALGSRRQMRITETAVDGRAALRKYERNIEIARRVLGGQTQVSIASAFGIAQPRVSLIARKYREFVE